MLRRAAGRFVGAVCDCPAALGLSFYLQAVAADPAVNRPLPVTLSDAVEGVVWWDNIHCCEIALSYTSVDAPEAGVVQYILLPCLVDDGEVCYVLGDAHAMAKGFEDDGVSWVVE